MALKFVRKNKTSLGDILYDYALILSKVLEEDLITMQEYNRLGKKSEPSVADLLDLMLNKGEQTCEHFLVLLREDQILKDTFPRLSELKWSQSAQPTPKPTPTQTQTPTLTQTGPRPGAQTAPVNQDLPADERLCSVRAEFIKRVSEATLDQLLDKLLQEKVLNDEEMDSTRRLARADKARALIDIVRKKGREASSKMISALCSVDPYLSKQLHLS